MTRDQIQEITRAISMTVGQILLDQQEGRGCTLTADEIRLLQNLGTAAVELDSEFQLISVPSAPPPKSQPSPTLH